MEAFGSQRHVDYMICFIEFVNYKHIYICMNENVCTRVYIYIYIYIYNSFIYLYVYMKMNMYIYI